MSKPRVLFVGRTTYDVLYWLDKLPEEDTKVYAQALRSAPGGPALNAAITHSLLGGEAMLATAIGGGQWAVPVRADLARKGVLLLDLAEGAAYETPLCTVLVNGSKSTRTIVNPPLATVQLPPLPASWEQAAPAWGPVPNLVLTDGFFIAESLELLRACKRAGAALCMDGGSWKPGTEELASLLSVAICGERFAVPGQTATPEAIFAWFAGKGVPYVAITRGARPILASDRGRRFEIGVQAVKVADTLGAGDVLHGAFCHEFALSGDFEAALRKASAIATLSCQSLGIQGWAYREEKPLAR